MLMNHCGMYYEECPVEMKDWPGIKSTMPGGSMPVFEFKDGTRMGQTVPMAIYVGKLHGIHPEDPHLAWLNDSWI